MDLKIFENLALIPELIKKIDSLESNIKEINKNTNKTYNLTKRKGVRAYLKISDSTIARYLKENIFISGTHYIKDEKGNIIFIESAIKNFKGL